MNLYFFPEIANDHKLILVWENFGIKPMRIQLPGHNKLIHLWLDQDDNYRNILKKLIYPIWKKISPSCS